MLNKEAYLNNKVQNVSEALHLSFVASYYQLRYLFEKHLKLIKGLII